MRLDPVLDSFYLLSSLWGGLPGTQVCPAGPPARPRAAHAAVWSPMSGMSAGVTAFVDVTVVPMDTERVLTHQTVLVEEGRITALGPSPKVKVPAGAVRIAGRGKYLMPGFTDMHAHDVAKTQDQYTEAAPWLFRQVAYGTTAIRKLNNIGADLAQLVRDSQLSRERPTPYFYLAADMTRFVQPGVSMDSAAAAYKAAGYSFVYEIPRSESEPFLAAAYRLGIPAASHLPHEATFEQLKGLGAYGGSTEHLYSFFGYKCLDSLKAGSADRSAAELRALAAEAKRVGVWITPTLDCLEGFVWQYGGPRAPELMGRTVKALHDAGVKLLLGEAYGPAELEAFVRVGLTPYQALRTGTYNAAQYFGLLNEAGTVAVGRRADLVLLHGNPLQDIRHTWEPVGVMLAGRWLDRAELDRGLLADLKPWFKWVVKMTAKSISEEYHGELAAHARSFEVRLDSLAAAQSAGPAGKSAHEQLARRMTEALGAMRAALPRPADVPRFESQLRVWLRDQARRGYEVTIPGITATP
jgi:hypothetical protein